MSEQTEAVDLAEVFEEVNNEHNLVDMQLDRYTPSRLEASTERFGHTFGFELGIEHGYNEEIVREMLEANFQRTISQINRFDRDD